MFKRQGMMVKKSKLFQRILAGSKNVRFADFTILIEAFGFQLERISGSHHIYSRPNVPQPISVQPDRNGQAKPYQLRQFTRLIEKYDLRMTAEDQDEDSEEEPEP